MEKVLLFNVGIKGLENKIWREIEIKSSDTLADLIYVIIASFELYSKEFFSVTYDNYEYDSVNTIFDNDEYKSAMGLTLKDISFNTNKELILEYDYQNRIQFIIHFIENREINKKKNDYPKVIDGAGKGAINYVSGDELKKIVEETDSLGQSNFSTTIIMDGEVEEEVFDYRDFELQENNFLTKCNVKFIKDDYEDMNLADVTRIIGDRKCLFYKTDINSIVNPSDYIKDYIPDNFEELSEEEMEKIKIPDYKDLNIYMLPVYEQLNHKEIMTSYVKNNIEDREIRKLLFYTLRNHEYMEKFYNNLRKYGLFHSYQDYSNDYYEQIIKDWKIKNNIK